MEMERGSDVATALLLSKVGSMLLLGIGSLLLGMLPLIIGRCRAASRSESRRPIGSVSSASTTLTSASELSVRAAAAAGQPDSSQGLLKSLLLCFGGGVLLFTTFLHLAPEARESIAQQQSSGQLVDLGSLSLADLLFCGGFFLVYLVEETVHALLSGKPESPDALLYRTVSVRRCNTSGSSAGNSSSSSSNNNNSHSHNHNHNNNNDEQAKAESGATAVGRKQQQQQQQPARGGHGGHGAHGAHGAHHGDGNSMRSLLTVLALSFHSIFEGLAVGLEPELGSVLYLAAAIATHKLVISFCVGMELYVAGVSRRAILGYLSVFAMVTPLGIALGLGLGHLRAGDGQALGPTPTVLQAMAAGTLLYVVFFEVLARERANDKSGLQQLAAIFVGFALMLGLQLLTAHSHNHGHESGGHDHLEHGNV